MVEYDETGMNDKLRKKGMKEIEDCFKVSKLF
jgi:hypothetical protein